MDEASNQESTLFSSMFQVLLITDIKVFDITITREINYEKEDINNKEKKNRKRKKNCSRRDIAEEEEEENEKQKAEANPKV